MQQYGDLMLNKAGDMRPSPYLSILNRAMEQMYKLGASFGLEPSARSRIHAAPHEEKDAFEEFLNNGDR